MPINRRALPSNTGDYNKARTKKVWDKNGDLYLLDVLTRKDHDTHVDRDC